MELKQNKRMIHQTGRGWNWIGLCPRTGQIGLTFGIPFKSGVIPSSSNNFCLIPGHPCTIRAHFDSVHPIPFHLSVEKRSYGMVQKQEVLI